MSGGLPPATAVARMVGSWSPAGVYFTVTFGYCCLKPSSTAWKFFCSSPVQTPVKVMVPDTLVFAAVDPAARAAVEAGAAGVVALELELELDPPQAASAMPATTASGPNRCHRWLLMVVILLRWRCPGSSRHRRSAARSGRRPAPPRPPCPRWSGGRRVPRAVLRHSPRPLLAPSAH